MRALSAEPGTWFGLQLLATFQLPPLRFVQEIVAALAEEIKAVASNAADKMILQDCMVFMSNSQDVYAELIVKRAWRAQASAGVGQNRRKNPRVQMEDL